MRIGILIAWHVHVLLPFASGGCADCCCCCRPTPAGAVKKAEVKEEKKVVKEVVVVKSHCAYFHKFGCHPWFSKHG
jgi:hypothetical protein